MLWAVVRGHPQPAISAHARWGRSRYTCGEGGWCARCCRRAHVVGWAGAKAFRVMTHAGRGAQRGARGGRMRARLAGGCRGAEALRPPGEVSSFSPSAGQPGAACIEWGDVSMEGGSQGLRVRARGAAARTTWRGMMMEALREGEEGGVELVVLVGLAESSCGDVGKAHVRTGLGLARPVDSGTAARTRGHGPPRRVPSGTCVFWGSRHPLPWAHQDEAPRSHSWAGLLPDKVTGSGTLTVGPSGMTVDPRILPGERRRS